MDALTGYDDVSSDDESKAEVAADEEPTGQVAVASEAESVPECQLCDEQHAATGRCLECDQNLCEMMARAHAKSKATSQHTIQSFACSKSMVQESKPSDAQETSSTAVKKKDKKKHRKEKKKMSLPSAATLLANVPSGLLGRAENVIDSDEEEQSVTDKPGTKYNQVAPPSNLARVSDEEAFHLKPTMSLELQRQAQGKQLDKLNKQFDRQNRKAEERKAAAEQAAAEPVMSTASSLQFAPRQITGRANVSTEDLEGMGIKNKKSKTTPN
jgi:hypothetical protein